MSVPINRNIRLVALLGSVREGNYTAKALALITDEVGKMEGVSLDIIDPASMELSLPGLTPSHDTQKLQESVERAAGVILATPEYHGSYSSVMKLMIDNLGFPSALSGKPIALLGVAGGVIGAIKALEHLRSVLSHVGAIVLPGPVSVARVRSVFDEEGICLDPSTEKRIRGVAIQLRDYISNHICPSVALEAMVRERTAA